MKKIIFFILIILIFAIPVFAADDAPTEPTFEVKYELKMSIDKSTLLFSEEPDEILTGAEYINNKACVFPVGTIVAQKMNDKLIPIYIVGETGARTGNSVQLTREMYELVLTGEIAGDKNGVRICTTYERRGLLNVMVSYTDLPTLTVKAEIPIWDGTVLLFSEKPVRAQWNMAEYPYDVAFVFPQGTQIAHKLNGIWRPIFMTSEYDISNGTFTRYGTMDFELTLSEEMGAEAYGVRIHSTGYYGRSLLPILIDGVSERAVNPGDLLIYERDMKAYTTKATDEATLDYFRQSSSEAQSNDPDIIKLSETITAGISSDYEKARAIHDWVAGNIWYDADWIIGTSIVEKLPGEFNWSATCVLRNNRGICTGYSNLAAALLRAAGIPARLMNGLSGGGAHTWNEVFVDGRWINMDVQGDSKNYYQNGEYSPQQIPENIYFDMPDAEFKKSHTVYNYADYILKNQLAIIEPEPEPEPINTINDDAAVTEEVQDDVDIGSNTMLIIVMAAAALVIIGMAVVVIKKKK